MTSCSFLLRFHEFLDNNDLSFIIFDSYFSRDLIAKETKEYNHLERISKTSWATDSLRSKYSLSKFNIDTLNLSPKSVRKETKRFPDSGSKLASSFDTSDISKVFTILIYMIPASQVMNLDLFPPIYLHNAENNKHPSHSQE